MLRRWGGRLLIVAALLSADALGVWIVNPEAQTPLQAVVQAKTEATAYLLVKMMKFHLDFPAVIDNSITLDDMRSEHSKVIYSLGFNIGDDQFRNDMAATRAQMVATGCQREEYRKLLSFGLTIVIEFHNPNGLQAEPVSFTPQMCGIEA